MSLQHDTLHFNESKSFLLNFYNIVSSFRGTNISKRNSHKAVILYLQLKAKFKDIELLRKDDSDP